MKRRRHLLVAVHALLALAVLGCYSQQSGPVRQQSESKPAPLGDTTSQAPASDSIELAAGTKAIVLAVEGMH